MQVPVSEHGIGLAVDFQPMSDAYFASSEVLGSQERAVGNIGLDIVIHHRSGVGIGAQEGDFVTRPTDVIGTFVNGRAGLARAVVIHLAWPEIVSRPGVGGGN